ncbi:hypothetical protein [Metallosphaera hakonensis]|uniref:hypothetical protein n=1 Tax=Metallosphaera hakonensis TaxID=79601 RepID=UPI000A90DA0A|nr:hypothetical protein [Metallosphaera hakonensis]
MDREKEIEPVIPYSTSTGDHGFYRKEDLYGVIMGIGKNVAKGKKIRARIIDVAPTLLKIMEIQAPRMEGRALVEALENGSQE